MDKKIIIPKKPTHVVEETKESFSIDGFEVGFVLDDGVTIQQLGEDIVKVNVSFLAKSYEYKG